MVSTLAAATSFLVDPLAAWLLTYAIHGTVILSALWLVSRKVSLSPERAGALWKGALLGGLVTALVQTAVLDDAPGRMRLPGLATAGAPAALPATVSAIDAGAATRGSPIPWAGLLVSFWIAGAAWSLGGLWRRHRRFSRRLRTRWPLRDDRIQRILEDLCRRSRTPRRIRITVSDRTLGPVAVAGGEICLPQRIVTRFSEDQLRSVLAHEMAHVIRRDPEWRIAAALVSAVFFFQPLNRVAADRWNESAELLSDDWAVRHAGNGLALARCLAEVAEWMSERRIPATMSAMTERGSSLVRRVERLLAPAPAPSRGGLRAPVASGLAALALVAALAPGVSPPVAEESGDAPPALPAYRLAGHGGFAPPTLFALPAPAALRTSAALAPADREWVREESRNLERALARYRFDVRRRIEAFERGESNLTRADLARALEREHRWLEERLVSRLERMTRILELRMHRVETERRLLHSRPADPAPALPAPGVRTWRWAFS